MTKTTELVGIIGALLPRARRERLDIDNLPRGILHHAPQTK